MDKKLIDNLIFKGLADPTRRLLLDLLFQKDGRTLGDLCNHIEMSRFGVMKHLNLLEEAGLVVTKKVGREKLHYLNPIPIQQIHNRWISKYAAPWTYGLQSLKDQLESESFMNEKPKHMFQILIKTTPEKLWHAITDPEMTKQFWYQCRIHSDWKVNMEYRLDNEEGTQARGKILVLEPPHRLVTTWEWFVFEETKEEQPSRITWEIEQHTELEGVCTLTVTHDQFDGAPNTYRIIGSGWPNVLSGLKTLLETGEPMIPFK